MPPANSDKIRQNNLDNAAEYTVRFERDLTYTVDSADNMKYDAVLNPEKLTRSDYTVCMKITVGGAEQKTALLIMAYCAGGIPSAVIEGNILTVLCDCYVYKICLDDFEIIFRKEIDIFGCAFELYRVEKGWIVYGEIEIVSLDENFDRIWGFWGEDIFCSCDNETCFEMKNDEILLCDWLGNHYALDYNGTVLREWQ